MQKWWNWLIALAVICLLLIAIPVSLNNKSKQQLMQPMFDEYIKKFNKTYKNNVAEYETRLKFFMDSMEEIDRLNAASAGPDEHRARYGPTKLSDMSKLEYREIHLSDEKMSKHPSEYGKTWSNRQHRDHKKHDKDDSVRNNDIYTVINERRRKRAAPALPILVDWRVKGVVGAIRNQGLCGACWAFSTVGAMEAMAAMDTGKVEPLSVQEVIDCAGLGNSGCAGGDICLLLDWLTLTNTAIETEKQYPLKLTDGACKLPKNATGVRLTSFTCDDLVGKEEKILEIIATHGPVAVAVNALTWQNYLGGVIQYHCSGAPADLNHAVELVGYDLGSEVPYYIAKNSWGSEFGLSGYIHLAVGSNVCGLANEVASVTVK